MSDTKTIIGETSIIRGSVEGDEDLVIHGRVEGSISLSGMLIVEQQGMVHADINVRSAFIHGTLLGNIEASETVYITSGGRMSGDIRAPRVVLEEGAAFNGNVDMGEIDFEAPALSTRSKAMPVSSRQIAHTSEPEPAVRTSRTFTTKPIVASRSALPSSKIAAAAVSDSTVPTISKAPARPPMPVPSRPVGPPFPATQHEKKGAPEPKVRPLGRAKARRP